MKLLLTNQGLAHATGEAILKAVPPVLHIFSSLTHAPPQGFDPVVYKDFILIHTMWYVHVKFFYQSPLYQSLSAASNLSPSEWNAKYEQFFDLSNKVLASGALLLIARILLDSLTAMLKRLASGVENGNLYVQIKSLLRTIQMSLRRVHSFPFVLISS